MFATKESYEELSFTLSTPGWKLIAEHLAKLSAGKLADLKNAKTEFETVKLAAEFTTISSVVHDIERLVTIHRQHVESRK